MNLDEYIFINCMTTKSFAILVDYTRNYVSTVRAGSIIPGKKFKLRVEKATKGKVALKDWK